MDNNLGEKKRRIENSLEDIFILNTYNLVNYKDANPVNLIIINTNYLFDDYFLDIIVDGGIKENVKKIITSDLIITKYIGKILNEFEYLFPACNTIQVNTFDNDCGKISRIIDNLDIIKNLEYVLDEHIFINYDFRNFYWFFIGSLLTGSLVNLKNITIKNNVNIDDFNDFITNKITKYDIVGKHNSHSIDFIRRNNLEAICFQENKIEQNKYINLINFKYIDFYGKVLLNDNLINLNQINLFEKCEIM